MADSRARKTRKRLAISICGLRLWLTHTITKSRETEDLLKALNRSSAVIEFTLDGHVIAANENFLDALNYRLDDIVDQHHRA